MYSRSQSAEFVPVAIKFQSTRFSRLPHLELVTPVDLDVRVQIYVAPTRNMVEAASA